MEFLKSDFRLGLAIASIFISLATSCPNQKEKGDFPAGTWMRSQEEDKDPNSEGSHFYRPASYPFPAARGRSGFVLRSDGKFALIKPSALDGRDTVWGSWTSSQPNQLKISVPGSSLTALYWKKVEKELYSVELR
jgi:hypothetical protein